MLISIIHPAARPHRLARVIRQWFERAALPEKLQYTACWHVEQQADFAEFLNGIAHAGRSVGYMLNRGPDHPTLNGRSSFVANTNLAASVSCGAVICLATDDLEPPWQWDLDLIQVLSFAWRPAGGSHQALEAACRQDWEAIVHCANGDDDADARPLILHPIMTRSRYERQSWFVCPAYSGVFSDNDLTERAARDGIVVDARSKLVFQHNHPLFGTAETDQVYRWQNATSEYERGKAIYDRRRAAGFPIGPHWNELGDLIEQAGKFVTEAPAE